MIISKAIIINILLIILGSTELFAHPHIFIGVQPTVKAIGKNNLLINIKYYIDILNSKSILTKNDTNHNNKLEKNERVLLIEQFKEMLESDDYYMRSLINDKVTIVKPERITTYIKSVSQSKLNENHVVVIDFDVKIRAKYKKKNNEVRLWFINKTYFCALNPISRIIAGKKIKLIKNQIMKDKCIFIFSFDL